MCKCAGYSSSKVGKEDCSIDDGSWRVCKRAPGSVAPDQASGGPDGATQVDGREGMYFSLYASTKRAVLGAAITYPTQEVGIRPAV